MGHIFRFSVVLFLVGILLSGRLGSQTGFICCRAFSRIFFVAMVPWSSFIFPAPERITIKVRHNKRTDRGNQGDFGAVWKMLARGVIWFDGGRDFGYFSYV